MSVPSKDKEREKTVDAACAAGVRCPLRSAWTVLILTVGYPVAALMLLFSWKSFGRLKADLLGAPGRALAREWGESIVVAFLLAMLIRTFFFQPFKIPSGSMRMTLVEGDRLFVNKLRYGPLVPFASYRLPGMTKPRRGDVIVFRYPVTRDKDFIKRLIAFGGETVEIRDGGIYINGRQVDVPAIGAIDYRNEGVHGQKGQRIVVPAGSYFVLGDNSFSSHDSRYWGFVPEELVIGRAELLFWPPNRIRWIR